MTLRIEVWSDVVCPFCWIGLHHLREAVRRLDAQEEVDVVHRAYRLDPGAAASRPLADYLARRFGSPEAARQMSGHVSRMGEPAGLRFDWARAIMAPTRDAHRLVRFAREAGKADEVLERLMRAHFADGADLGDAATLRRLAEEAGLDGTRVAAFLEGDEHLEDVLADEAEARAAGVGGVPFFVIDRRYAVSGAQPVEVFVRAIERARADAKGSD